MTRFKVGDKVLIVHDEPPQSWVGMHAVVSELYPFGNNPIVFDYTVAIEGGSEGYFDDWELDDAEEPRP